MCASWYGHVVVADVNKQAAIGQKDHRLQAHIAWVQILQMWSALEASGITGTISPAGTGFSPVPAQPSLSVTCCSSERACEPGNLPSRATEGAGTVWERVCWGRRDVQSRELKDTC